MAAANPTTSIIFFLLLTLGYFIFKYYTKSPSTVKTITMVYFLVLIIAQFLINLGLTNEICGFTQPGTAIKVTLLPWLFIFGTINLLLMLFPYWLSPFSNTIGYLFAYITGVDTFFKSILADKKSATIGAGNADMVSALNNVYEDKSLLINSMTPSNLTEWWSVMKKGGLLKSGVGDAQFDELSGYVKMKTEIAEFMWYALTGVLTTSISYNAILNAGCEQSVKEMEKRHAKYLEQESNIAKAKQQKEGSQMVYKSYE